MPKYLLYEAVQKISPKHDPEDWVCAQYLKGKSCNQISQEILHQTTISITPKGIAYFVKKRGLIRTKAESFANSIKTGRMDYSRRSQRQIKDYKTIINNKLNQYA